MVNYNQIVNELLTTCHPHSPADKEPIKASAATAKASPLYLSSHTPPEQRLSVEEMRHAGGELGVYFNVMPEETDLIRLMPSLPSYDKSSSRVSEMFLNASRGDSAFVRVSSIEEPTLPKLWNSFDLIYKPRIPTIQNDLGKSTDPLQLRDELSKTPQTNGTTHHEQSAVTNLIKQTYFSRQSVKTRKRRKVDTSD
eukprot:TRINITY_DN1989_c0_g2_i3.p2 TRINITY_DN1989_c0_g2~~TRINITY_DN1989_c0_g2_i3.p2  ORF type:complete len:196 (+),score=42.50 TRINITY_DN1989_c0_g2_i3:622-1209(+)